ncbi:type II toxin-antitoxin system RelE/ParE family toxin [bacterium]|nr:type II toxin-antitoxin system RelE/ParE family toxin [bacterium]
MANYKILIKPSAAKELKRLPQTDLQRITSKIQSLSGEPRPRGCEKLSAQERYRVRQGSYRIVYSIEDAQLAVYIVKVGHRREVYKR